MGALGRRARATRLRAGPPSVAVRLRPYRTGRPGGEPGRAHVRSRCPPGCPTPGRSSLASLDYAHRTGGCAQQDRFFRTRRSCRSAPGGRATGSEATCRRARRSRSYGGRIHVAGLIAPSLSHLSHLSPERLEHLQQLADRSRLRGQACLLRSAERVAPKGGIRTEPEALRRPCRCGRGWGVRPPHGLSGVIRSGVIVRWPLPGAARVRGARDGRDDPEDPVIAGIAGTMMSAERGRRIRWSCACAGRGW